MRMDDVQICNHAIALCGSTDFIQSLTDNNSVSARRCQQFFIPSVERCLAEHDWSSSTKLATLAQNTSGPIAEYQFNYTLPFDCVKVVQVFSDDAGYSPYNRWKVRGRNLQTNLDTVILEYVQFPEDYRDLDVLLTTYIAYEIAMMLAPTLVKNPEMYALLNQAKEKAGAKARAMDTMQDKELYTENDVWEDNRLRVGGSASN